MPQKEKNTTSQEEKEVQQGLACIVRRTLIFEHRASLKEGVLLYGVTSASYKQLVSNCPPISSPLRQSFVPHDDDDDDDVAMEDSSPTNQKVTITAASARVTIVDGPGGWPFPRWEEDNLPTSWADDEGGDGASILSFV
ncbi:hypothetical protein IAR50_005300 [Cryptococcus sp. DSM 104548]